LDLRKKENEASGIRAEDKREKEKSGCYEGKREKEKNLSGEALSRCAVARTFLRDFA
jgi:hypothetical protein